MPVEIARCAHHDEALFAPQWYGDHIGGNGIAQANGGIRKLP
jgi:hypothetical protein